MAKRIFLIPVYNEEQNLPGVLTDISSRLQHEDYIIFVEDGSLDNSHRLLKEFKPSDVTVKVLAHSENRGLSHAILSGLKYIEKLYRSKQFKPDDVIVNFDADGQHDLNCMNELMNMYEDQRIDAVFPSRDFSSYPLWKVAGNRLMTSFCSIICKRKLKDAETGFRSFRIKHNRLFIRNLLPVRYSCAQQMIVAACRSGINFRDDLTVNVQYYRSNTRIIDALLNPLLALVIRGKFLASEISWKLKGIK